MAEKKQKKTKSSNDKSWAEIWMLPITGALIAGILGLFGTLINMQYQKAESQRQFNASQIEAVNKLSIENATDSNFDIFAARLVAYGKFSVAILTSFIESEDTKIENRTIAERALVQIAKIYGHKEIVGAAMLVILQNEWQEYRHEAHESALRVIGTIRYSNAEKFLEQYSPEKSVKEWGTTVMGTTARKEKFYEILKKTKENIKNAEK